MSYRIDADARLLYIIGVGTITQPERIRSLNAWLHDPAFTADMDAFCDFSDTNSTPSLANLRELIAIIGRNAALIGRSRLAILTGKPITFGVARVFEAIADVEALPVEVRVFFNREEAWSWLRPGSPQPAP